MPERAAENKGLTFVIAYTSSIPLCKDMHINWEMPAYSKTSINYKFLLELVAIAEGCQAWHKSGRYGFRQPAAGDLGLM